MSGQRQKTQYSLASEPKGRGETPVIGSQRAEPLAAKPAPESPAVTDSMFRARLNPVEPPWYATRTPGGVGGAAP